MKLSKYNYVIKLDNEVLIWNTFRESLMTFTKEYYSNLIKEKFDTFTNSEISVLLKNGILIDSNIDELNNVLNRKNELKNSDSSSFIIALTQKCNARCYYCYQHENVFDNNCKSNKPDYDRIVDFILKNKHNKVKITWFGGEPLIESEAITYISKKLKETNVDFQSTVITNGLLLDSIDTFCLKNKWNTCEIQVTFDGLYQNHDKRKGFGKKGFDKIIQQLKKILECDIAIKVRINISKDNYDEINEIFNYFENEFNDYKNFKYYYSYITDDLNLHHYAFEQKEIDKINPQVYSKYMENKRMFLPRNRRVYCGAQNPNTFFIDIFGNIYKCEHDFWRSNKIVMNISDFDFYKFQKLKNVVLNKKCKKCKFLPICQGGCIRNGVNECPQYIKNVVEYIKNGKE